MIEVIAPAKINLFLEVLGRRGDGFHEIRTIFQRVSLYDKMRVTRAKCVSISCTVADVPTNDDNLAFRAAVRLSEVTGKPCGAHIHIIKNIPVAAGLAGGSSNAAATLIALNELYELGLTPSELAEIGASLGSDVPFFFTSASAFASGRGEVLEPLPSLAPLRLTIVAPRLAIRAAWAYDQLPPTQRDETRSLAARAAFERRDSRCLDHCFNRLEDSVLPVYSEVSELKQRLAALDANPVLMSGSGPAVFGVFSAENKRLQAVEALRRAGYFAVACSNVSN